MIGIRAFGLAYQILSDGAADEGAVQEAFLALWRQSARIDGGRGRADSLLMTLVHRRSIDALRARERWARISEVIPGEAVDRNAGELFD